MTAGQDKTARLWNPFRSDAEDLSRALLVQTYTGPHGYEIKDVAMSADNSRFATAGQDKPFFLWDVATARVVRRFAGHDAAVNTVAFNPVSECACVCVCA
jgi:mitogen-activated protein kinase organizer 1